MNLNKIIGEKLNTTLRSTLKNGKKNIENKNNPGENFPTDHFKFETVTKLCDKTLQPNHIFLIR